jgi:hypothetical protein
LILGLSAKYQHRLDTADLHGTMVFNLVSSEGWHDSFQSFTVKREEESPETSLPAYTLHSSEE